MQVSFSSGLGFHHQPRGSHARKGLLSRLLANRCPTALEQNKSPFISMHRINSSHAKRLAAEPGALERSGSAQLLERRCQGDKQDSQQLHPGCRRFLVYLVSKGPQQLGGLKKPTCVHKPNRCKSLHHGARSRWGRLSPALGAFAVPSPWAVPLGLSPIPVLRVLCQVSVQSQDQAALHKPMAKGSSSPAPSRHNPNNAQAAA